MAERKSVFLSVLIEMKRKMNVKKVCSILATLVLWFLILIVGYSYLTDYRLYELQGEGGISLEIQGEKGIQDVDQSGYTLLKDDIGWYRNGDYAKLRAAVQPGYTFLGWFDITNQQNNLLSDKLSFDYQITRYSVLKAQAIPLENTQYIVNHYQMGLDGINYVFKESETKFGTTDSVVVLESLSKTYDHFTYLEGKVDGNVQTNTTIQGDGTRIIDLYYSRNKYHLDLNATLDNNYVYTNLPFCADIYINGVKVADNVNDFDGTYGYGSSYEIKDIQPNEGINYRGEEVLSGIITQDTSVYIPLEMIQYSISYNLNGGSLLVSNPATYCINTETFTLYNPTKEGYIFTGWTGSNGTTPQINVSISKGSTGNKSYEANWERKTYAVTLNYDDGITSNEVVYVSDAADLPTPSRDGYIFDGWYKSKKSLSFTNPQNQYTWKYSSSKRRWSSSNGGVKSSSSNMLSTQITLSQDCSFTFDWRSNGEANYDYLGYDVYNVSTGQYLSNVSAPTYQNCYKTLKGKASTAYQTETVQLSAGKYQLLFMYGKDVSVDRNEDRGFVYNGFYLDKVEGSIQEEMSVIAKWKKAELPLYTVTFVDGLGKTLKTQSVEQGDSAVAPATPKRTGYTFEGWDSSYTNITSDKTITATWAIKTFTVTFEDGFGRTLKTQIVEYGSGASAPSQPSHRGYIYDGWDRSYSNVTSDITVKATWKENLMMSGPSFQTKIQSVKSTTTSIKFLNAIPDLSAVSQKWDVSAAQDGRVMAWMDGTTMYIASNGVTRANARFEYTFRYFLKVSSIQFNNYLDTDNVVNMDELFYQTGDSVRISFFITGMNNWDVSNVESMYGTFYTTANTALYWSIGDISGWDTSNVKNMHWLFFNSAYRASSVTTGDLNRWNVSSVTDMTWAFESFASKAGYVAPSWYR